MKRTMLGPLTVKTAPAESVPTLEKIQKGYGFIPNLMATFANSPAVLDGYMALDSAWEKSSFNAVERTLVLLAASVANDCGYCIAAHSTVLKAYLKVPAETVAAVRSGKDLGDAKLDALVKYTRETVETRGHASEAIVDYFLSVGYTAPQAMEVLIGIALKTISNYLDHINPVPIDVGFKAEAPK